MHLGKKMKHRLFTMAKTWKPPEYPSTDEWVKKMWYIRQNRILLSHKKKNEIMLSAATWMDLECIIRSEVRQRKKNIIYHLYVESKNNHTDGEFPVVQWTQVSNWTTRLTTSGQDSVVSLLRSWSDPCLGN